ncbi:hypothetical protein J6590_008171 [Homalodisca vitripennis]|nr:hypothetical protein J6590_008171 [Homalodisca vitripennis]
MRYRTIDLPRLYGTRRRRRTPSINDNSIHVAHSIQLPPPLPHPPASTRAAVSPGVAVSAGVL